MWELFIYDFLPRYASLGADGILLLYAFQGMDGNVSVQGLNYKIQSVVKQDVLSSLLCCIPGMIRGHQISMAICCFFGSRISAHVR